MLIDEIKKRVAQAMKDNDAVAKGVLRLALGEMQTAEARTNRPLTDEESAQVLRKLIKSNEETLALASSDEQKTTLTKENTVLASLLPASLTPEQIAEALAPVKDAILAAKN